MWYNNGKIDKLSLHKTGKQQKKNYLKWTLKLT